MQARFKGLYTYFELPITPGAGMLQTMRQLRELKNTWIAFRCPEPGQGAINPVSWVNVASEDQGFIPFRQEI